jgi:hypothetical protein
MDVGIKAVQYTMNEFVIWQYVYKVAMIRQQEDSQKSDCKRNTLDVKCNMSKQNDVRSVHNMVMTS